MVLEEALASLFAAGARQAGRGGVTKRAFLLHRVPGGPGRVRDDGPVVAHQGVEQGALTGVGLPQDDRGLDGSRPLTEEDREVIRTAQAVPHVIAVQNKSDLPRQWDPASLEAGLGPALSLSAREGQGLEELEAAIARLFPEDGTPRGEILTNARQAESLSRALASLRGARLGRRTLQTVSG